MDETTTEAAAAAEGRREFFKTVGRSLVLGLTGAGVATMVYRGRIDLSECIDEKGPCARCPRISGGCQLPKAQAHRRIGTHGGT
jgi:hypothetical protein